jgi:hypothetical protein
MATDPDLRMATTLAVQEMSVGDLVMMQATK